MQALRELSCVSDPLSCTTAPLKEDGRASKLEAFPNPVRAGGAAGCGAAFEQVTGAHVCYLVLLHFLFPFIFFKHIYY